MKKYSVSLVNHFAVIFAFAVLIGFYVVISIPDYRIVSLLFSILIGIIIQLPYNMYKYFMINYEYENVTICKRFFLFWERKWIIKFSKLTYMYKIEPHGKMGNKTMVLTIILEDKNELKIVAPSVGFKLLDSFVKDLDEIYKSNE